MADSTNKQCLSSSSNNCSDDDQTALHADESHLDRIKDLCLDTKDETNATTDKPKRRVGKISENKKTKDHQLVVLRTCMSLQDAVPGRSYYGYRPKTLIDHAWSKRVLEMVGNKAKLMESFSWLSTLGGGFSALGERDSKWSMRAGALSLGQQLHLAELLGDERLKVMCHLFACLAALQMENRHFCVNYIRRVVVPLIKKLPHQDQIIKNILVHIIFRISQLEQSLGKGNAIKFHQEGTGADGAQRGGAADDAVEETH